MEEALIKEGVNMAVRKQTNRYRVSPSGYDYEEVLSKAKRFYRAAEVFEMYPYITTGNEVFWSANSVSLPGVVPEKGTRRYCFNKQRKRWEEVEII